MSVKGYRYDGKSSNREKINLSVDNEGNIIISSEEEKYTYSKNEYKVLPRLGVGPVKIQYVDGSSCEIPGTESIDQYFSIEDPGLKLRALEGKKIYVTLAVILTLMCSVGLFKYGVPYISRHVAELIPKSVESSMGTETLKVLDKIFLEPSLLPEHRNLQLSKLVNDSINEYDDASNYTIEFRRSRSLGANALALPSGIIIITDDMVALADDDREILAVIGHEIGHIQNRHAVRLLLQDSMFVLFLVFITGDMSSISTLTAALPTLLVQMSYSRSFETESDSYAKEYFAKRNIDKKYLVSLFEKLGRQKEGDNETGYLSSHPAIADRIKNLQE